MMPGLDESWRVVRGGFTIVEMVLVITLTMIIALAVVPPFLEANKAHSRTTTRIALVTKGRTALERMVRELRGMAVSAAVPDLSVAADDTISFESLSYRVSSGALERSQDRGSTWRTLCSDVTALALSYVDESDTALTSTPMDHQLREQVLVLALAADDMHGLPKLERRFQQPMSN